MKRIDNEKILDMIYDLADGAGMRIDDFMAKLERDYGVEAPIPEGIPEEIALEIAEARELKKRERADSQHGIERRNDLHTHGERTRAAVLAV